MSAASTLTHSAKGATSALTCSDRMDGCRAFSGCAKPVGTLPRSLASQHPVGDIDMVKCSPVSVPDPQPCSVATLHMSPVSRGTFLRKDQHDTQYPTCGCASKTPNGKHDTHNEQRAGTNRPRHSTPATLHANVRPPGDDRTQRTAEHPTTTWRA